MVEVWNVCLIVSYNDVFRLSNEARVIQSCGTAQMPSTPHPIQFHLNARLTSISRIAKITRNAGASLKWLLITQSLSAWPHAVGHPLHCRRLRQSSSWVTALEVQRGLYCSQRPTIGPQQLKLAVVLRHHRCDVTPFAGPAPLRAGGYSGPSMRPFRQSEGPCTLRVWGSA